MEARDRFPKTSWTLLEKAREQCDEAARARESLAQRYYQPAYEFLRILVHDAKRPKTWCKSFSPGSADRGNLEERTP